MKYLPLTLTLLAASVYGQQASAEPYGFGCASNGDPFGSYLSYTGVPRLGSTFSVNFQTSRAPGVTTGGRLYTGFSRQTWAGMRLPIWIPGLGIGNTASSVHCMLWTSLDIDMGLVGGFTQGSMQLTVPNQPSLIGLQLYQQWFLSLFVNQGGTITQDYYWTNGGVLTIGL